MILALVAALLAQDKSAKLSPAQLVQEGVKALRKAPQYAHASTYKCRRFDGKIAGVVRKEVHLPLEGPEIYAKFSTALVKAANGKYLPPNQVDPQSAEGKALGAFRNPEVMLSEIESAAMQINPERRPDEGDCAVLVVTIPAENRKALIKSVVDGCATPIPLPVPQNAIDYDRTLCRYLVWISKSDLTIVKYRFDLEIATPEKKGAGLPAGLPGGFDPASWTAEITVEISLKDVSAKPIPKEVQSKLGIK